MKKATVSVICVLLAAGFLVLLFRVTTASYEIGMGLAFDRELTRLGLASSRDPLQQMPAELRTQIVESVEQTGRRYAAAMGIAVSALFCALLVLVLFAGRVVFLRTGRSFLVGVALTGIVGLALATSQVYLGQSVSDASAGALGIWMMSTFAFAAGLGIILAVRYLVARVRSGG